MGLRAGEDVAPWDIGYIEGSSVLELLGAGQGQPPLGLLPAPHFLGGDGCQRVAPGTQGSGISGMWFWTQIEEG